jgi:predicted nuclease of restriction endonuclease-like (RecB) superfamily
MSQLKPADLQDPKIDSLLGDLGELIRQARHNIAALNCNPREFIRDPVILEFLGLPSPGKVNETGLEQALIDHLQSFLLELGKGFSFVARQQRISAGGSDLYIDLVFYNYLLKCFVIIDLKRGQLSARDVGQMDMYVRMYDELKRSEGDKPTVGIILCSQDNEAVARYSILKGSEQLFASSYKTVLPSVEELRAELQREQALIEERLLTESTE